MNFKGILKFDWSRVTLLSGGGLHYNQESFGGEICTWMKNWHGYQRGDTFLKGSSAEVKFLQQPQTLKQETWPPENPNLLSFPPLQHTICSHALGWNFWPTGALLHRSVKRPWLIWSKNRIERLSVWITYMKLGPSNVESFVYYSGPSHMVCVVDPGCSRNHQK